MSRRVTKADVGDILGWAVGFRRSVRGALWPYYPNNPMSGDEELTSAIRDLVAFWKAQGSPEPEYKRRRAPIAFKRTGEVSHVSDPPGFGTHTTQIADLLDLIAESVIVRQVCLSSTPDRCCQTTWGCGVCQGEYQGRDMPNGTGVYAHSSWCPRRGAAPPIVTMRG